MEIALTPREIQARIRGGASVAEVAEEAGVDPERIRGFAGPVLAEREHMARNALGATIRRRGDGSGHRRLGDLIRERLQARGLDSDEIVWDAWRLPDLKWQLVGLLDDDAGTRQAEFQFDPRGRFSIAGNADARWLIGEELPNAQTPDDENTVDFNDELALVRATMAKEEPTSSAPLPGDDVPFGEGLYGDSEHTSELDDLYDMMSGISEDSVRIYVGLDESPEDSAPEESPGTDSEPLESGTVVEADQESEQEPESLEPAAVPQPEAEHEPEPEATTSSPEQDALTEELEPEPEPEPKPAKRRRRAKVPSWDEIMFGGPSA